MITYFVLKDEDGKAAGSVRLENGRARSSCPCTLLLEDGTLLDLGGEETTLPGRALGAAVMRGDALTAWGAVPGSKLTGAELLYRLKRENLTPPEPAPTPAPEPDPMPEPEPMPESEPMLEPEPMPESGPMLEPEPQPSPDPTLDPEPATQQVPEPSDSAALAADFGLLIRHAGEVYDSILNPPLPEGPAEEEPTVQGDRESRESWFCETERLIAKNRRPSSGRRRS